MASTTTTTGNGASAVKSDYEALKNDMKALREDFAALMTDSGKVAGQEYERQAKKAKTVADSAGKQMVEFRDVVEDKVRDHPFAAIGIALAAGFIVAAMAKR
jgi:ElaB/YqjD/DUF883 family membrane-anchored ribosome-binding protein